MTGPAKRARTMGVAFASRFIVGAKKQVEPSVLTVAADGTRGLIRGGEFFTDDAGKERFVDTVRKAIITYGIVATVFVTEAWISIDALDGEIERREVLLVQTECRDGIWCEAFLIAPERASLDELVIGGGHALPRFTFFERRDPTVRA